MMFSFLFRRRNPHQHIEKTGFLSSLEFAVDNNIHRKSMMAEFDDEDEVVDNTMLE